MASFLSVAAPVLRPKSSDERLPAVEEGGREGGREGRGGREGKEERVKNVRCDFKPSVDRSPAVEERGREGGREGGEGGRKEGKRDVRKEWGMLKTKCVAGDTNRAQERKEGGRDVKQVTYHSTGCVQKFRP